jgi:hypothetical protein
MAPPDPHSAGFSPGRRWLTTLNLLLATAAALALVVMLNYLAEGHYKRYAWADATRFKLSPQTLDVLHSLTNDVQVTIFYQRKADVYTMIRALLAEYQHANHSHIQVTDLDYVKSPGEARRLLARLRLGPEQKDFVAFEDKGNGQRQICYDIKLSDYDFNDMLRGGAPRRRAFLGELYFTSAVLAIAHPRDQKAYFLTGHGERDAGDPGQRPAPEGTGYTKLAAILANEMRCHWTNLVLSETDSIPADCSLLIIPSGRQTVSQLSSNELFQVQTYLRHGNARLLALLDTTEGLEPVLTNWGVVLPNAHVIESDKQFLIGGGQFLVQPAFDASSSSVHPIMRALARAGSKIQMDMPRPILAYKTASRDPGAPTLTAVAATTTNAVQWPGERALTAANGTPLLSPPYILVAAIEQGVINGRDGTRMVVAGDADFLDDQMIDSAANHTFASQTLDWLLSRPETLAGRIGPRPIPNYQIFLPESQMTQLRWLFLAAMPGSVLFLGGLVWLRRRS